MLRSFSLALLVLFSVGMAAQDKRTLMVEVLQTARDFGQVAPVWHIISRQEDIFRFVPSVAPLKERYRISDRFGYRVHPISGRRAFHAGLDMAAEYAATVQRHRKRHGFLFRQRAGIWQNGGRNPPLRLPDTLRTPDPYLQAQGRCGREGRGGRFCGKHRTEYGQPPAL